MNAVQAPCRFPVLRGVAEVISKQDCQDHQRNDTDTNHYRISETLAENSIFECSEIGKTNIPSRVVHCHAGQFELSPAYVDAIKTVDPDAHMYPPFGRGNKKQYSAVPMDFYCTNGDNREFSTLPVVCCY